MGGSANSMKDNKCKEQKIELPPPSPALQRDDKSQWMEWGVTVPRQVSDEEKRELQDLLSLDTIRVSLEAVDAANLTVIVKQSPIGDYTQLYDTCVKALFHLEKRVGTLLAIEGLPRARWEGRFIVARRFGALE